MKYVRKLIPVEPYKIDALESWFSELSAEGLHLYAANTFFATFEKKEEKRMIYRMEAKLDGLPDRPADKEKDSHKGKGWKFVTELGKYFFIYSAKKAHRIILMTRRRKASAIRPMQRKSVSGTAHAFSVVFMGY